MIPKSRSAEFGRIFREIAPFNNRGNNNENENGSAVKTEQPIKTRTRYLIMERDCLEDNFGFNINGDLFTKQEIVASKVDKHSIADASGLKEGDRIVSVNGINCWRSRKADVISLVKGAESLYLEVICATKNKGVQKGGRETMAARQDKTSQDNTRQESKKHVTVATDEHGCLGCCIRGGTDYACDVHIISVDDGFPAQRAGLRKGDVITEVNGVPISGKTHIQVVDIILRTCPPVTFTVDTSKVPAITIQSSTKTEPKTPLRISSTRTRNTRGRAHHQRIGEDYQGHASTLGLGSSNLKGTPPPPYTTELPEAHRVLQPASTYCAESLGAEPINNPCSDDTIATDIQSNFEREHMREDALCHSLDTNKATSLSRVPQPMKDMKNRKSSEAMISSGEEPNAGDGYEAHHTDGANPHILKNTGHTFDFREMGTSVASSSTKPACLLDDIISFKHSLLRKTEETTAAVPTVTSPDKQQSNSTNLLDVIHKAMENRARVMNSSCESWSESCESEDEWQV